MRLLRDFTHRPERGCEPLSVAGGACAHSSRALAAGSSRPRSPLSSSYATHFSLSFISACVCVRRRVFSESDRPPFRLPSRSLASSPRSALRTRRFPSLRNSLPVRPRFASVQEFLHSLPQSPTRNPIPKVRRRLVPSSRHLRATRVLASLGTSSRAQASTGQASTAAEPQPTRAET